MKSNKRRSPIAFDAETAATENRSGWNVVLSYKDEAGNMGLSDLSHWSKWDFQDKDLSGIMVEDVQVPEGPGDVSIRNGRFISRLNKTQMVIWQLEEAAGGWTDHSATTDVTDAYALIALFGRQTARVMEKISALDLCPDEKIPPFLLQGPVLHVPMQVVVMGDEKCVLLAFARGYGQTVADALLQAGAEFGLKPAGERSFLKWFGVR